MQIHRARFKKQILCEFVKPVRESDKAIILCTGLPSVPAKKKVMEFFRDRGYWVFLPRYRGTWESDGQFLKESPHKDILDMLDVFPRGFRSLWDGRRFILRSENIHVIGSSFGGTAAIFASRDSRVKSSVALSPVVDWTVPSKEEPLDWLCRFVRDAFGQAYRFKASDWNKLKNGWFYNPMHEFNSFDGSKLLLFHAKDDTAVPFRPTELFAEHTGAKLHLYKTGGHYSTSDILAPRIWKQIEKWV